MTTLFFRLTVAAGMTLAAITCLSAEQLYTTQPSVTPELANPGPYTVGVTTLHVTHHDQLSAVDFSSRTDRPLTLEVWYPANHGINAGQDPAIYANVTRSHKPFEVQGQAYRDAKPIAGPDKFPLVVFSHGYTGYRTIMFYLGEHLASHGYVVAAIDHTDSTNADVDMVHSPASGFASTLLNRARDQQFVLDYLTDQNDSIAGITDTDNAALVGYSMGGYGAINTVGGCYAHSVKSMQVLGFGEAQAQALKQLFNFCNAGRKTVDPRWRAMMALAPWGGELNLHSAAALAKIAIPTLYVDGDLDDIAGFENGTRKLYEETGSAHKYLMVYQNARHNIAAHPAPAVAYDSDLDLGHYFEPSWHIETINRINKHMALAFLDCHVKNRTSACTYLPKRESINQSRQPDGTLSPAWPGFPDRWGTGVRFYRR